MEAPISLTGLKAASLRPLGMAEDDLAGLLGAFIPFAKSRTAPERRSTAVYRRTLGEPKGIHAAV